MKKILRLNLNIPECIDSEDKVEDLYSKYLEKSINILKISCKDLLNNKYIKILEKVTPDGITVEILKEEDFVLDFFRKIDIITIIDLYFEPELKKSKTKSAKEEVLEEIIKRSKNKNL